MLNFPSVLSFYVSYLFHLSLFFLEIFKLILALYEDLMMCLLELMIQPSSLADYLLLRQHLQAL